MLLLQNPCYKLTSLEQELPSNIMAGHPRELVVLIEPAFFILRKSHASELVSTKSGKPREVPIPGSLQRELKLKVVSTLAGKNVF